MPTPVARINLRTARVEIFDGIEVVANYSLRDIALEKGAGIADEEYSVIENAALEIHTRKVNETNVSK